VGGCWKTSRLNSTALSKVVAWRCSGSATTSTPAAGSNRFQYYHPEESEFLRDDNAHADDDLGWHHRHVRFARIPRSRFRTSCRTSPSSSKRSLNQPTPSIPIHDRHRLRRLTRQVPRPSRPPVPDRPPRDHRTIRRDP
jgi:hypothetical protein